MKKFMLWQYMINKRLLRKKEFLILLGLIPLLVWGIRMISKEDSGVVTIALSVENETDKLALQIVEELMQDDSIIRYRVYDAEKVYEAVASQEVDCAWVFREDFQNKLLDTFAGGRKKAAPVYVVATEDNVALQMARTKLYGIIFPHLAYLLCEDFLEDEVLDGQSVSREELLAYYEQGDKYEDLFQVEYTKSYGGTSVAKTEEPLSYLVVPVRGILLIFILVAGLVVTMYYLQDEEQGKLAWVPVYRRRVLLYSYILAAVLDASVVSLISIVISEEKWLSLQEVIMLIFYLPVAVVFCEWMRLLCRTKENMAKTVPLLVVGMLGLCPIFLDMGSGFVLQYLFPPTYYLRALNYSQAMLRMPIYAGALFVVATIYHMLVKWKNG